MEARMATNPLVGAWRLVATEIRSPDGRVRYPFGRDPSGYLIYAADGRMSATIMAGERTAFGTAYRRGEGCEAKAAALETYLSYAGRYEFLGDRVVHRVEIALIPDTVDSELVRLVTLEGDHLILSGRPTVGEGEVVITWERVAAGECPER
jgi:hypothetical protein